MVPPAPRSGLGTGAAQSRAWHAGLKGRRCDSLGRSSPACGRTQAQEMICEPTPGLQGRASRDGASGAPRSGLGTGGAQSRAWHAGLKGRRCDSLGRSSPACGRTQAQEMICEPTPGLKGRASRDGASGAPRSGLGTGAAQSRAWHAGLKGRRCDSLGRSSPACGRTQAQEMICEPTPGLKGRA